MQSQDLRVNNRNHNSFEHCEEKSWKNHEKKMREKSEEKIREDEKKVQKESAITNTDETIASN